MITEALIRRVQKLKMDTIRMYSSDTTGFPLIEKAATNGTGGGETANAWRRWSSDVKIDAPWSK